MKRKLLSLLLALVMVLPVAVTSFASAKTNTISTSRTIKSGMTVEKGTTLTIPEGVVLTLNPGSSLNILGNVDLQGKIKVKAGAKVTGNLYGMNKKLVGKASDVGTSNAPVVAISEGSVVLRSDMVVFRCGLYQMARNANFSDAVKWKTDHEVFLEYLDNVKVNVKITGPKNNTEDTKYNYAKLQLHEGASNKTMKKDGGKIYWWLKDGDKGSWMYFNYADLFRIGTLAGNVVKDPSYIKAAVTKPNWSDCMEVNNTQATEPEWTSNDGTKLSDIVYDSSRDELNSFDMYIPKSASKTTNTGVLLFIHGGGWSDGEKADMNYVAWRFARMGYITATMDYRLFPSNVNYMLGERTDLKMEDLIMDIDNCVAKMKTVIQEQGYKADKLGTCGYSAGGHLALLYAYTHKNTAAIPVKCTFSMCGPVDMHIDTYTGVDWPDELPIGKAGYLGMYTGLSNEDMENPTGEAEARLRSLSPAYQVTSDSVPTLMLYGDYDQTIGLGHAPLLNSKLNQYGVTHEYYRAAKSDHPLELDHQVILNFMEAVTRYANNYLK